MLEHKCKDCGLVWHDKEYDTLCPQCWSGKYTTEWADVQQWKYHKKPIPDSFIANEEQRLQKAAVKRETELLKKRKVIK